MDRDRSRQPANLETAKAVARLMSFAQITCNNVFNVQCTTDMYD